MSKKVTKSLDAALKVYPEKMWMGQIGYVNPYHKERVGFQACWSKMIDDVGVNYKEADRNYRDALKQAKKSGLTTDTNVTYYKGVRSAYLSILRGLMDERELSAYLRKK